MSTTETPVRDPVRAPQARRRAAQLREGRSRPRARRSPRAATSTSLEEIARRAEVGIGTLYRNFPTRQALLEAVYVDEVEALCRSAAELDGAAVGGAVGWLHRFVGYLATKQALAARAARLRRPRRARSSQSCRAALYAAGEPLLERAQEAGVVRADTDFAEVIQMVGGIAKIPTAEPGQIEHILTSRSTACATAPRHSSARTGHGRGALGQRMTVIVNVCDGLVSWPLWELPPLSCACTVTLATPSASSAGV